MIEVFEAMTLRCEGGTSNKIYHIQIVSHVGRGFQVVAQYGGVGRKLQCTDKTSDGVEWNVAKAQYDATIQEKAREYEPAGFNEIPDESRLYADGFTNWTTWTDHTPSERAARIIEVNQAVKVYSESGSELRAAAKQRTANAHGENTASRLREQLTKAFFFPIGTLDPWPTIEIEKNGGEITVTPTSLADVGRAVAREIGGAFEVVGLYAGGPVLVLRATPEPGGLLSRARPSVVKSAWPLDQSAQHSILAQALNDESVEGLSAMDQSGHREFFTREQLNAAAPFMKDIIDNVDAAVPA